MNLQSLKKTKVICTVGPASSSEEVLTQMVKAGMNVMRLNFSHGDHAGHLEKINTLRKINESLNTNVAILLDTKGPEIRTGDFENGIAELQKGQKVTIVQEDILGNSDRFSISYKQLYRDVAVGGNILIDDGQIALVVEKIEGKDIICTCLNEGIVKDKKGINVPGIKLGFDYLSQKDIDDIAFGCENKVDFIAASFVRRAQDVLDVKKVLVENNQPDIKVIAKIENQEGVDNMDEILEVVDGIMVARGDLGVEIPADLVPVIQKKLIKKCNAMGKVVITATQMLESMQKNPRPTRAEVSDVANAIHDGTDAIMLSGESASGKYPVESVQMMAQIARTTEANIDYGHLHRRALRTAPADKSEAICLSVAELAMQFDVKAIIAFTQSGFTAEKMSRYRPECLLIAATPDKDTINKLALNWGVIPAICSSMKTSEALINLSQIIAKEHGVKAGESIIVTGGTPGVSGTTNFLHLIEVK
ncbi:MAG: pyruvate kinase [Erysipelotrichaceae bacterium]|nr:pyruvate kinase [Erysipelotrichaceae bacterium]